MQSQLRPILFSLTAAVFGALANWLYRRAAIQMSEIPIWRNVAFFAGLVSFILVLVLMISSFRLGGKMMVVYPVYSTTYVWAAVLAIILDHEKLNWSQFTGISLIMLGVSLIGYGART